MSAARIVGAAQLVLPAGADRSQWLTARRSGITATDVTKIIGLSKYGSALDVYLDKRLDWDDTATSEAARWGHLLEDQVAREWARRHGARIRRVGLVANRQRPHHLATCDRLVVGERASLECKTRSAWAADEWDDGSGGVTVPDRVMVQCQWQAHVIGADRTHVAALVGGQRLVSAVVERDQSVIDYLTAAADRVWDAVRAGVPPDVPAWQLTAAALDRLHPERAGAVDLDPATVTPLIEAYRAAGAAEKAAQAEKEAARLQMLALLGDGEQASIDGQPAYAYRASTQTTIPAAQARALLAAHPDLAADYAVTRTVRRFTLAKETT